MKHKRIVVIIFMILSLVSIYAQKTQLSSGGNASGIGGSVNYSVGQIVYIQNKSTNMTISQGVQQPFEISVLTGLNIAKDILLLCSAYPNPATDYVIVKVENYQTDDLVYQLLDSNGKLLVSKKSEGAETIIMMTNFKPAIYLLEINQANETIKTFKIIKK
jgi:hypothetical protein